VLPREMGSARVGVEVPNEVVTAVVRSLLPAGPSPAAGEARR
jgi:hypothetical protein